ncbi:hypothetical protein AAC387_Pa02g0660 [Persea americana]
MACICRSAVARSIVQRSKTLVSESLPSKPVPVSISHSTTRRSVAPCISRISLALGCMESLMPLHSAVASSRLKSILGVGSNSWSCLSQGFAMPL